jgi:hypothetical protein
VGNFDWSEQIAWAEGAWSPGAWLEGAWSPGAWEKPSAPVTPSFILLVDGSSFVLLSDGTSKLQKAS